MTILRWLMVPVLAVSAHAATIASDNFDTSATGLNTSPTGWTTTSGTVDTFNHGDFSLPCLAATGRCVDLDGSTGDAGVLTWNTTFTLSAGVTYTLSYYLAGSQRGDSNVVTVTFGGVTAVQTLVSSDPYTQFFLNFTPVSNLTALTVSFSNAGGDNSGALLDSVAVSDTPVTSGVPEPSTTALLLSALAALPFLRSRLGRTECKR